MILNASMSKIGGEGQPGVCLTFGPFHREQRQLDFVDVELAMLKIIQQSGELLMMFTWVRIS